MEPFIVENAGNTCYIDSLLMALFYSPTHIERLLNKEIKNTMGLYLQEYIKHEFVNKARSSLTITCNEIEMIRALCFQLGWRKSANDNSNNDEYISQQDVNEFYIFLMDIFENDCIEITKTTISDNVDDKIEDNKIEKIPFIPLALPESTTSITVKDLLSNWLTDNISDIKTSDNINKKQLHIYNIANVPYILCLSINRFNNHGIRIDTDVIIQKKICPYDKKFINQDEWSFHAAICHRGVTNKSGHYYCLLQVNNIWYIFDDLDIPCMREVRMDDKSVTDMIKKDCVFLIYKLV
ncbi:ubiquitin carboxyl-terminal hydrolase [Fadolivirus algeromassiliense]|jgi:ubiquitin C-terminal hydrolase|uniref:Ubiquitin carboxyl-terminal hydrolase n=1 Tax=Fadolivirus FV1/VV64 TaxID=3070911 RepID=A0A7D3R0G8_9VIRU|nr:ubiquitin carboxyl-terminal hydrolase [Fadolivirus algeromassiliense]QKF93682.1 ubiquitin carboxyl-terminal hydrolase [Fadolivirus FV1/VV64]